MSTTTTGAAAKPTEAVVRRALRAWHAMTEAPSADGLRALLADDAVFWSPVMHAPQRGRELVVAYLSAALVVLFDRRRPDYVRECVSSDSAVLEFVTHLVDAKTGKRVEVNGVDIIHFDGDGRIVDFKVMLRPYRAATLSLQMMGDMLRSMRGAADGAPRAAAAKL